jgi:hypothetical protein
MRRPLTSGERSTSEREAVRHVQEAISHETGTMCSPGFVICYFTGELRVRVVCSLPVRLRSVACCVLGVALCLRIRCVFLYLERVCQSAVCLSVSGRGATHRVIISILCECGCGVKCCFEVRVACTGGGTRTGEVAGRFADK